MALILWYRLVFGGPPPLPDGWLSISNDVFAGSIALDAEIAIDMREGATAPTFTIRIADLPRYVGERIKSAREDAARARQPLTVAIHLGYFEKFPVVTSKSAVLRGAVTRYRTRAEGGRLTTEISGQDLAAWKLLGFKPVLFAPGGDVTPAASVRHVLDGAGVEQGGEISGGRPMRNRILRAPNGLAALGSIAYWAGSRFAVRDGVVQWPSRLLPDLGPPLAADINVVSMDDELETERPRPRPDEARPNDRPREQARKTYRVSVLGEPSLRPGQTVPFASAGGPPTLHVNQVRHTYGARGYLCELVLEENGDGTAPRAASGAARLVERFRELTQSDERPHIDVGEVSAYDPGSRGLHLASVHYGQRPDPDTVAPSVETPVERREELQQRPIASPFAWHRCGLVVPVYPGQRTLLAHNRGDANDVVLHGSLWAENPLMERPRNEPGDWWLCLPTEVRDDRPSGRGANDLIDGAGLRAIQARGLSIAVGADRLPELGERPTPPEAETLTIEHAGGTTITVARDGAVEIRTDGRAIRLTNGDSSVSLDGSRLTLTNGTVRVALSGAAVEVS